MENAVGRHGNGRYSVELGGSSEVVILFETVASSIQTIALGLCAREVLDSPTRVDDADPVDPLRIALSDIQVPGGPKGYCLGHHQGGMRCELGVVRRRLPHAHDGSSRLHLDSAVAGQFQDDVIVDDVKGIIERINS